MDSSRKVIYAGLAGNLLVAVTKFGAAWFTHSSAMLSEAVHSLVDTANQGVMLYGMHRAARPASAESPMGHGRELYFWSFVVAVLIFAVGAGVSVYEGINHILHPEPIVNPIVNYVVLGLAAILEGASWTVAMREFRSRKGDMGYFEAAEETKDPSVLTLFLEDSAALIGIGFAFAGTLGSQLLDMPVLDGVASIAIGVLLAIVAMFLARETKRLLIGEQAHGGLVDDLKEATREHEGVHRLNGLFTVQMGPRQVVAILSVEFDDALRVPEVERVVEALEAKVRERHPEVMMLLVKPQRREAYERGLTRRRSTPSA